MTATARMSLAALLAVLAAGVPMFPLTKDRSYLFLALVLIAGSVMVALLARRIGVPEPVVRLLQLAPALVVPWLIPAAGNPVKLYRSTVEYVATAFAPMDYDPGFAVFCALLLWLAYLMVETLANGLAMPAWTFAPLVLPYTISALALYAETGPGLFVFPALGYSLLLVTGVRNAGDSTQADMVTVQGWRRGMLTAAAVATALALAGSVLLSVPLPERSGTGNGPGDSGAVRLGDPSLDLIRNINEGGNQTIIRYRTSDGGGDYLRLTALSVFDDLGFHLSATELVPLPLPSPADLPFHVRTETVESSVEVLNFGSEYLPAPWFPTAAQAGARWRYDPRTLSIVAIGSGRATATTNLSYQVTSERLPSLERLEPQLREAGTPSDDGLSLFLPGGISPEVFTLAREVTADADTAGERALALQDFLRSSAFTYSTAVAPGTTLETLDDFLLTSRTGYCEQFAGAMAVLARILGIPSRVVVGFLPGKKVDGTWEITPRNMHAWTELYFGDGIGWVPFDATPSGAVGEPTTGASPTVSASTPSLTPTAATPTDTPSDDGIAPVDSSAWVGPASLPWVLGGLGVVAMIAAAPLIARRTARWHRLRRVGDPATAVEGAWDELRAVVQDHGRVWPAGTPRQVAAALGAELDPGAHVALVSLALLVERARYSGEPVDLGALSDQVASLSRAIDRWWAPPTTWFARWWPRSVWPRSVRGQRPSS